MIRVLHSVVQMSQGGIENFLMNVYRNIDRNKIQFDFLTNNEGYFDKEIQEMGGKIYRIPGIRKVSPIKYKENLYNFFHKYKNKYKIVHVHGNQSIGIILEQAKKAGIPIRIAHSHNNKFAKSNVFIKLYKKYLGRSINENSTVRFACSGQAGKFLFGKNTEFEIINNAIDTKKFIYNEQIRDSIREQLNIDENCFLMGNVGRFSYQKNQIFLLKIFEEFNNLDKNSKLLLIGKGENRQKIEEFIEKNNLKNKVIILQDRTDVNELMQGMDFFVLPSKYEGLGIVLIEAQAAGLKCIASADVIPKEAKATNLLEFYPLENTPKQWAEEIYRQKEYKRKDTYEKIKKSGFDINETVKQLENLYINLAKKGE